MILFVGAVREIFTLRGPAILDLVLPMIGDRLPEVRVQGIGILDAFAREPRVFSVLQACFSDEAELNTVREAAFRCLVHADPVNALGLYMDEVVRRRKTDLLPPMAYAAVRVGEEAARSIGDILRSGSSDSVKHQALRALQVFVQEIIAIVPPSTDRGQEFRRMRFSS